MSWSQTRWIAVTVVCLWVLGGDVYSGFQPVRRKLVRAPLPSQQSVSVPLTGVDEIREPFVVIVCRLRNEGDAPVSVSARVDGELLREISLSPGISARVDLVWAPRTPLPKPHRLELVGSSNQWTVLYVEAANVHGFARGVVNFLILPSRQPFTAGPRWALLACCGWAWLMWRIHLPPWPRRLARGHFLLSVAVAVSFGLTAVSGLVSPYRIVLSAYTFVLGLAVLAAPQILHVALFVPRLLPTALIRRMQSFSSRLWSWRSKLWSWSYAIAALIATAGALSLIYQWYRTRPLWVDEEMIALNVRDRHFAELAGRLWMNQAAPFGWLALQRLVLVEVGSAERTLRAVPVLFAIATLIAAFWVGRRWMGPLGAAIFVLLCSFSEFISYFPLEIKHYSADVFFGLLLPALAVWTIEWGTARRVVVWWLTASVALWFANGAVFVVPGCTVVLCVWAWHRAGWRSALQVALPGVIWLASFAVHYQLSIGPAIQNQDLQNYWSSSLPPQTSDLGVLLRWLGAQAEPLAINPGGTGLWIAFWLAVAGGLLLAARANLPLGLVLLSVPMGAFLLAALRFVPLAGRLFLWAIPALYAALAIAADGTVECARQFAGRRWLGAGACALGAVIAIDVSQDIVRSGVRSVSTQPASKHNLDDRSALRILTATREPGDVLATMHLGLPAVWWYGGVNVGAPNLGRTFEKDGGPILEIERRWGADCVRENLTSALAGRSRVAVYLGFESRNPEGLQELVLDSLSQLGRLTAYRGVAEEGVVAVFDLRQPSQPWIVMITPFGQTPKPVPRPTGCVGFFPAVRW